MEIDFKNTKVITFAFAIANATAAGQRGYDITLPHGYTELQGFYLERPTGTDYTEIQIADDSGNIIVPMTTADLFSYGSNKPEINKRFFTGAQTKGAKININYKNPSAATMNNTYQLIMLVKKSA